MKKRRTFGSLGYLLLLVLLVQAGTALAVAFQFGFFFEAVSETYLEEGAPLLGSSLLDFLFSPASSYLVAIGTAGIAVAAYYGQRTKVWATVLSTGIFVVLSTFAFLAYRYWETV